MNALEMLLRGGDVEKDTSLSLPLEVIIQRLREYKTRFDDGCQFKPGDIVTPLPDSNYKGQGEPHLVLEVFDEPHRCFVGDVSSHYYGALYDMRVISLRATSRGETIVAWTVTSCDYQLYVD